MRSKKQWFPLPTKRPAFSRTLRITVLSLVCYPVWAQSQSGQAEVSLQAYSLSDQSRASWIAGPSVQFSQFLPGHGLLTGHAEAFGKSPGVAAGDNYLQLQDIPALNARWTLGVGDFHISSSIVRLPFQNLYFPEITARGVNVTAERSGWRTTLFFGGETISEGPRIPFRRSVPQKAAGLFVKRNFGRRVEFGVTLLRLWSKDDDVLQNPWFFPLNRRFVNSTTLASQVLYRLTEHLSLAAEGSVSASQRLSDSPDGGKFSGFGGISYENGKLVLKANYIYQSTSYLPLLGYFSGDRRGLFGEARLKPWKRLDLYGSSSSYQNNVEQDARIPTLLSRSNSAGMSLALPAGFSVSGQYSQIRFSSSTSGKADTSQVIANIARPIRHHTIRLGYRDLGLRTEYLSSRQRSIELEDVFLYKHVVIGGSLRFQESAASQRLNSVYTRGSIQTNLKRFTIYSQFESGNDLLNKSVFSTSNVRMLVAGVGGRIAKGWDLHAEVFQNSFTNTGNVENAFLQGSQGMASQPVIWGFKQSSVYFRLSRHLAWGKEVPAGGLATYAESQTRLRGQIAGLVTSMGVDSEQPAEGVTISLDEEHMAVTDSLGRFLFSNVTEGSHRVLLAVSELPAGYDLGSSFESSAQVRPGKTFSVALTVWRLGSIRGQVNSDKPACASDARIRLAPTGRYTTSDSEGFFAFENLREGEYEVAVDSVVSSELCRAGDQTAELRTVKANAPPRLVAFDIKGITRIKPIRRVELAKTGEAPE